MGDIRRLHQLMPTAFRILGGEPELEVHEHDGRHPLDSGWIPLFAFVLSAALTALVLNTGLRLLAMPLMPQPLLLAKPDFVACVYVAQPDCVIDGKSFRAGSDLVRLADIEVPAIAGAECRAEALHGERAMRRLLELLNAGPFRLEPAPGTSDPSQRLVTRDGQSLGAILIAEAHARPAGATGSWC